MRSRALLTTLAAAAVLCSGCAARGSSAEQSKPAVTHSHSGMSGMPGMSMPGMMAATGPSESARMICGAEIRHVVQRTFGLGSPPATVHTWAHRLFTCTYQLPHGSLQLSVEDSSDPNAGRTYFDGLHRRLSEVTTIHGAEAFGFPALQTPNGNVVFLKDGKTLRVDASALSHDELPATLSREETAYGVAAAVIACWTE